MTCAKNRRKAIVVAVAGTVASLLGNQAAWAANYYWDAGSINGNWSSTAGGTNWSSSPTTLSDPGTIPGVNDDVIFSFASTNPVSATVVDKNFAIKGLSFNAKDINQVSISGSNILTIGTDGITIATGSGSGGATPGGPILSTNVAIGGTEVWANNATSASNTLIVSGILSGSSALTLQGSGSTITPSGSFAFTNADTYSGALTLGNANTGLSLNGNGTLLSISSLTLNGGTMLTLDNSGTALPGTRLSSSVGITSNGGTITFNGNATTATSDNIGTLTLGSGSTTINAINNGAAATFTVAAISRPSVGSTVAFNPTAGATIPLTTVINGTYGSNPATIIGAYAVYGTTSATFVAAGNTSQINWATVSGGIVQPLTTYNTASLSGDVQATSSTTPLSVASATVHVNSLYLTGNTSTTAAEASNITFAAATNTLIVDSGGIISNGGGGSFALNGQYSYTNATAIGTANGDVANGNLPTGNITSGTGDLVVYTANGSSLRLGSFITDNGSTVVGLTKTGNGTLDLSDGNNQSGTKPINKFTGKTAVDGGILLVNADAQLGTAPASLVTNQLTLNGGELRTTAGFGIAPTRGITVGPQGGTLSYVGGNLWNIQAPITGQGGVNFEAIGGAANSPTVEIAPSSTFTYAGPTSIESANTSYVFLGVNNPLPSTTALTVTNGTAPGNGNTTARYFDLHGFNLTVGSLAGQGNLGNDSGTTGNALLSVGGNNLSTNYSGILGGPATPLALGGTVNKNTAPNVGLTKTGTGILTLSSGAGNTYTGGTTITGGGISVTNTTGSGTGTGAVAVNNGGSLGGSGIITGAVTVAGGGALAPATSAGGASTLQLSGGLTLNGGALLNFNLGAINSGANPIASPTSDNVFVTGNLSMGSGTDTININALPGFTTGTYHLITNTGTNPSLTGITFSVNGPVQDLYSVTDNAGGDNSLDLTVTTNPNPFLTWVGAPGNGTWNTVSTNIPWKGNQAYVDGANVTFDNSPGGTSASPLASAISIPGNIAPTSITFNNNSFNNYTFSGAGMITGATGLTMTGTGTATFNNVNTFTGTVNIQSGTLVVGSTGALANPVFNISSGGTLTVNGTLSAANGPTIANAGTLNFTSASQTLLGLTGAGSLTLQGTALSLSSTQYDGPVSGTGSLNITGGTVTLSNGGNTYGGGTTVSGTGTTLLVTNVTGAATGSGLVTVGTGATLGGTGIVTAPVTVNSGGTLSGTGSFGGAVTLNGNLTPAGAGTVGTIKLGSVSSAGGAVLNYDFGAPGAGNSDTATVNGALSLSGADTLDINALSGFTVGKYPLFTVGGAITNTASFTFNPTNAPPVFTYAVQTSGNTVQLVVSATTITWTGSTNGNWDTTTPNWSPAPTGTFANFQQTVFDDTGANTNITVAAGGVSVSGMTFNNSALTYTIGGGPIGGPGGLTKNNSGLVILTGANTYTGGTTINGGTLQLGNGTVNGTFGSGTYSVATGTALSLDYATAAAPAWANISGAGTLDLRATAASGDWGTAALPAGFTGTLKIENGHVASDAAGAALGGTPAIIVGAGATPGAGGQFDMQLGGTFAQNFTIAGSGYGVAGQESALRLANSSLTSTLTGSLALSGNATIGAGGTATIPIGISGPSGANLTLGTSGEAGMIILSGPNTYAGTTTVAFGTAQFTVPGALYSGAAASWTPTNITVNGGATLALNVGGPGDFTAAQVSTLLTNLTTGSTGGLRAGASLVFDTTNQPATSTATISSALTAIGGGALGSISKVGGPGTLILSAPANSYSGTTTLTNGELIINGSNTGNATATATNTTIGGTTVLSIRNANALGPGSANSALAPVTLNATGTLLSASILEIGARIGTDPGGNNADFSYQIVAPGNGTSGTSVATNVVAGPGQINLGFLGNNNDGTGFAAYNANSLSTPRIVALYTPTPGSTTLATIREKYEFGQGSGDHLTLGSPTANNTLVLLNPVDLVGGPTRRFDSIRGVGIVPEGEYAGAIINFNTTQLMNINFDGNGGLIFDSANTSYLVTGGTAASITVNGGAIFVAANDPAVNGTNGALGNGAAPLQLGSATTTAAANIGFLTYGPNNGVGASPTLFSGRNIVVGAATGITYNSAVLGGATNDYTQLTGTVSLAQTTVPTTFFARNGGRVDFGGVISGAGSVVIGGSSVFVEGDAAAAGIPLLNNGTIAFNAAETYTGTTTVSTGTLLVNGSTATSAALVNSGGTLGGTGTIGGAVNVAAGGIIEAARASATPPSTLTISGNLTFNGAAQINFPNLQTAGSPSLTLNGTLNTNSNMVSLNITAPITAAGTFALISAAGVQGSPSTTFTLATLPNRDQGTLTVNGSELDLNITALGSAIVWTGATNSKWDTTTQNWTSAGSATAFIDNSDGVVFDDTALSTKTNVTINGADVHPSSVTFNNTNNTYTVSGTNAIAGVTGLSLTGTGKVIILNTNRFTGATSVGTGATLQIGNGTAGNDGSIGTTSGITDNGTLAYNLSASGNQTFSGVTSGTGNLSVQGGTIVLTNAQTYSGSTTISPGATLQLGNGATGADGSLNSTSAITDNGTLALNVHDTGLTIAAAITGTGQVTKTGIGTAALSNNANSFSNGLTINQGTVAITGFPASAGTVGTVGTGPVTIAGTLQLSPGAGNTTVFNLANNLVLNGGILLSNDGVQRLGTGTGKTINIGSAGGTIENRAGGEDAFIDGQLTGSGPLSISNVGGGTSSVIHVTNNTNTFSGTLTTNGASGAGVQLSVDANNALASATVNLNGNPATASALLFGTGVTTPTFGALSGSGNFDLAGASLTVGNSTSTTYSGAISDSNGSGSLIKAGTGSLTLTGTSTYAGPTTITGGALIVNGALSGTGLVTVNANAVLGGKGSIAGAATVSGGGRLAPSTGLAAPIGHPLTISSAITLTGGPTPSTVAVVLATPSTGANPAGYDQIAFGSTVNLAGANLVINDSAYNPSAGSNAKVGDQFWIMDAVAGNTTAGQLAGAFAQGSTITSSSGLKYLIQYDVTGDPNNPAAATSNDVLLTVSSVPEPASLGTLAVGALGLLARRRRRAR